MEQVFLTKSFNVNICLASVGYSADSFNTPYGWNPADYTIKE